MNDVTDGAPKRGKTLVSSLIEQLEALSLAHEEGQLLGAEDALLARFGVSRPTLRQAAKVAEAESMISVRRGLRGGFYAARPDAAHAIRAPARYLRLHDATLKDMHAVSRILMPEAAALAAACEDASLRGELAAFRVGIDRRDADKETVRSMIDSEHALGSIVARMTGNPVIMLVFEIAYAFGGLERTLKFYRDPEDRHAALRGQRDVCDALLAGDAAAAREAETRRGALVSAWIR